MDFVLFVISDFKTRAVLKTTMDNRDNGDNTVSQTTSTTATTVQQQRQQQKTTGADTWSTDLVWALASATALNAAMTGKAGFMNYYIPFVPITVLTLGALVRCRAGVVLAALCVILYLRPVQKAVYASWADGYSASDVPAQMVSLLRGVPMGERDDVWNLNGALHLRTLKHERVVMCNRMFVEIPFGPSHALMASDLRAMQAQRPRWVLLTSYDKVRTDNLEQCTFGWIGTYVPRPTLRFLQRHYRTAAMQTTNSGETLLLLRRAGN